MEKESFVERVVSDLVFAAEAAEVLCRRPRALEEFVREPRILRALREDADIAYALALALYIMQKEPKGHSSLSANNAVFTYF